MLRTPEISALALCIRRLHALVVIRMREAARKRRSEWRGFDGLSGAQLVSTRGPRFTSPTFVYANSAWLDNPKFAVDGTNAKQAA